MIPYYRQLCLLVWAALLWAGAVSTVHAHGVNWTQESPDGVIALAFEYSDGTKLAFASLKVVDPDGRTFQSARTDRQGRFALAAQSLKPIGEWTVSVSDGQGHVMRVPVQIKGGETSVVASPQPRFEMALWLRAVFGLSLIANLTVALLWGAKRRRMKTAP